MRKQLVKPYLPFVATIAENEFAVTCLIEYGVCLNKRDRFNWAPIHHAALLERTRILSLLLQAGADKDVKTNKKADYITIRSLAYPSAYKADKLIRLLGEHLNGTYYQFSNEEYLKKSSAYFLEDFKLSPSQVFETWSEKAVERDVFPFISNLEQLYLDFKKSPIVNLLKPVTHNSFGDILPFSPGMGIFAAQNLPPYTILGEYLGEISDHPELLEDKEYLLENIDGKNHRNEVAQINDGFCNTAIFPIYNIGGLSVRYVLVSIDPIKQDEQLCWNYTLGHKIKEGPYIEFRPKELRETLKKYSINHLLACYNKGVTKQASAEEFSLGEKFFYLFNTPSVLFTLFLEKAINKESSLLLQKELVKTALNSGFPEGSFKNLRKTAISSLEMHKTLALLGFEKTAFFYINFVKKLPEKTYMLNVLNLIDSMNEYLKTFLNNNTVSDENLLDCLTKELETVF